DAGLDLSARRIVVVDRNNCVVARLVRAHGPDAEGRVRTARVVDVPAPALRLAARDDRERAVDVLEQAGRIAEDTAAERLGPRRTVRLAEALRVVLVRQRAGVADDVPEQIRRRREARC